MPADLLEAERLVEGDAAVDVADAVAGVDELGRHGLPSYRAMILERSMTDSSCRTPTSSPRQDGGEALFIDAGGPMEPLFDAVEQLGLTPTAVLLTHHHFDHICELDAIRSAGPASRVYADPREGIENTEPFADGQLRGPRRRARCTRRATPPGCSRSSSRTRSSPATRCSRTRSAASARPATRRSRTCAVDHGHAAAAAAPRRRSARATPTRRRSPRSSRTTRSSALWRGLDDEGDEPCTVFGDQRRRSSSGATTTTAATRRGSAGPTAATTSSPARRWKA